MEVKYKSANPIAYKSEHAAGIDLPLLQDITISKGTVIKAATGVSVEIPTGYVGLLAVRSSLAAKGVMLVNGIGVIDSDYRGEIGVLLTNITDEPMELKALDRIGQLIIVECPKVHLTKVAELSSTQRGAGGFGSTGTK
ncbi:MAG: dUTP diphosphatase [Sphingobacteriaceae bacterium]|nr:MAG: dUTP diphosphatase [Sphingobacteriaceae bacterium]